MPISLPLNLFFFLSASSHSHSVFFILSTFNCPLNAFLFLHPTSQPTNSMGHFTPYTLMHTCTSYMNTLCSWIRKRWACRRMVESHIVLLLRQIKELILYVFVYLDCSFSVPLVWSVDVCFMYATFPFLAHIYTHTHTLSLTFPYILNKSLFNSKLLCFYCYCPFVIHFSLCLPLPVWPLLFHTTIPAATVDIACVGILLLGNSNKK